MGEQVGNLQIFCRIEQIYSSHRIQAHLDEEDNTRSDGDESQSGVSYIATVGLLQDEEYVCYMLCYVGRPEPGEIKITDRTNTQY